MREWAHFVLASGFVPSCHARRCWVSNSGSGRVQDVLNICFRLRQSWYQALDNAQTTFRQHLTSHSSPDWKRVNVDGSQSSAKGKARASAGPHLTDVIVHRKVVKGESVYRAVLDIPTSDEPQLTLEACKAVLATPELRKEWDPAVERAQLLEMFDQATRISKTNFTLGWPVRYATRSFTRIYRFISTQIVLGMPLRSHEHSTMLLH